MQASLAAAATDHMPQGWPSVGHRYRRSSMAWPREASRITGSANLMIEQAAYSQLLKPSKSTLNNAMGLCLEPAFCRL